MFETTVTLLPVSFAQAPAPLRQSACSWPSEEQEMAMVTSARAADTAATATARQSARVPATLPAGRMVSSRLLRGPSAIDRQSVVLGKSVAVSVDLGVGRIIIQTTHKHRKHND